MDGNYLIKWLLAILNWLIKLLSRESPPAMIKQTKQMLGIFRDGELHTVVECPGATTYFSDQIYTSVEADDVETLMAGKPKPTAEKLRQCFHDRRDVELKAMCAKIGIETENLDSDFKVIPKDVEPLEIVKK